MDALWSWPVFVVALAVFGVAFAAMAIGVMLSGRCLRGSCGGPAMTGPDGERVSCANCPNRRASHGVRGNVSVTTIDGTRH
jgi:hypothetical protein